MDLEAMNLYVFFGVDIVNKHKYANLAGGPIASPAMGSKVPMLNIIDMRPGLTAYRH